jgi:hypothetical protein
MFVYSLSDMRYKSTLWDYYIFLTLNLTMTAGLELTLTSNIYQQHGCILPSTLNDSLRLRAVLLVQFVDNAIYACLPLLTCSYTNLCNERTQRLYKTLDNIYDGIFK